MTKGPWVETNWARKPAWAFIWRSTPGLGITYSYRDTAVPQKTPHRSTHPTEKQTPTLSQELCAGCELFEVTRTELLGGGRILFFSGMCGVFCGNHAGSLRNPETRRTPSYTVSSFLKTSTAISIIICGSYRRFQGIRICICYHIFRTFFRSNCLKYCKSLYY